MINYTQAKRLLYNYEIYTLRNHQNEDGDTPLHIAATVKDINMVQVLLDSSTKLNVKNKQGITVASLIHQDLLELLKKRDMSPAISKAADEGDMKYLKSIMNNSERDVLLSKDSTGRNILHKLMQIKNESHTVHMDYDKFVEEVLKNDFLALGRQTDQDGNTSLHVLVRNTQDSTLGRRPGLLAKLLHLYDEGKWEAPWSVQNVQGNTPLHEAIITNYNNTTLLTALLELYEKRTEDAPWLVQNVKGNTPLHEALIVNNTTLVKQLLELYIRQIDEGPWWLMQNEQGNTPVHEALRANNTTVLTELLRLYDSRHIEFEEAPWLVQNVQGNTPVHEALIANNTTLVRELLKHDPTAATKVNAVKEAPLHLIAKCPVGNDETILLSNIRSILQANVGAALWRDKDNLTPLLRAFYQTENLLTAKRLAMEICDQCPEALQICDNGQTFWHLLVNHSSAESVLQEFLQNKKLRILLNKKDKNGDTPLHLLIRGKRFNIAKIFLDVWRERKTSPHGMDDDDNWLVDLFEIPNKADETPSDLIRKTPTLPRYIEKCIMRDKDLIGLRSVWGIPTTERKTYVNTIGIIATLLATLTFTAAFTVPGGLDQDPDTGTPVLIRKLAYQFFMIGDIIATCLSMMVLFCLLWIMTTSKRHASVMILDSSLSLLLASLYATIVTFVAGLFATVFRTKPWIAIVTLVPCFLLMLLLYRFLIVNLHIPFGKATFYLVRMVWYGLVDLFTELNKWSNAKLCRQGAGAGGQGDSGPGSLNNV